LLHRHKPSLPLEEILRDRYPTFADALHDMDDALSMVNLFTNIAQNVKIQAERVDRCVRLCREFEKYVIYSRSLRKVFCSIKGYYYQAEICGQPITWFVRVRFHSRY
jgi:pescadillo protein